MPFFGRRMLETLGVQFASSLIFALPIYFTNTTWLTLVMLVMILCVLANFVCMFIFLSGYIFSVEDIGAYFKTNILVVSIFTVLAMVLSFFEIGPFYTLLFFPYEMLSYLLHIPKAISAFATGLVYVGFTSIIPLFVKHDDVE